jgi:hypothetical protein
MRRGALHRFADLRLTCRSCLQAGRRALPEGARAHPPASRRHLEPRSRLWLWQRRRIGPVIRALDRATDPRHYWPRRARVFERPKQKLKRCDTGYANGEADGASLASRREVPLDRCSGGTFCS